jgi:cysteine desulfurase family protein (TIGR01976 family)
MSGTQAVPTAGTEPAKILEQLAVRKQFPALAKSINGQRSVFLDGPGGTQVPQCVIEAVSNYYANNNANSGGAFPTSIATDAIVAEARSAMSDLLGCNSDEIVFGANMTTLTFALSRAFGKTLTAGDKVLTTQLDHDANVAPWKALEEKGVIVESVAVHQSACTLDLDDFARKLTKRTKLVAIGFASNAVGTINDVARIVKMSHDAGALVYVDAVHYAPHGPIDVKALDCDFLACSPYKFFAPHMGTVYGKREHLARLQPYKVRPSDPKSPGCWETGTQNFEAMAGLVSAIEYLATIGGAAGGETNSRRSKLISAMKLIRDYERTLSERMVAGLLELKGLSFYGISDPSQFDNRTPTFGFNINGHDPGKVAKHLADNGIFVWDGNFYALQLTELLGLEGKGGMVRVGAVHYNTVEEIDRCLEVLTTLR